MADRYSQIIATVFIVMMYSLAMPFLYIAAMFIFVSMYWSDKILFLRYWRTPPKYTTEIVRQTIKIMQFAILLHLLIGLFMISNPKLFSFQSSMMDDKLTVLKPIVGFLGAWAHQWLGVHPDRFKQVHTIVYLAGIIILFALFFINKVTGVLTKLIRNVVTKLTTKTLSVEEFSSNLLRELSFDDLQMEYSTTLTNLNKALMSKGQSVLQQSQCLMNYYVAQL